MQLREADEMQDRPILRVIALCSDQYRGYRGSRLNPAVVDADLVVTSTTFPSITPNLGI